MTQRKSRRKSGTSATDHLRKAREQLPDVAIPGSSVITKPGTPSDSDGLTDAYGPTSKADSPTSRRNAKLVGAVFGLGNGFLLGAVALGGLNTWLALAGIIGVSLAMLVLDQLV